jgi:hypothetical protein
MTAQTIMLHLPDEIYRRLQHMATVTRQPLEGVLIQSLRGNLPPLVEDLPPDLQGELMALQSLDDQALWQVVKATLKPAQWREHQDLLHLNQAGVLSVAQQEELTRLRAAVDRFVFRRSCALAILKWRGYSLPEVDA